MQTQTAESSNIQTDETPTKGKLQACLLEERFLKNAKYLLTGYCLVAALSIAASQIFIVSLIFYCLAFLLYTQKNPEEVNSEAKLTAKQQLSAPTIAWFLVLVVSCAFGFNYWESTEEVLKTGLYLLVPFFICDILLRSAKQNDKISTQVFYYLSLLCISQFIAAIHSLISAALDKQISPKIPGPITESGQLVMILPCLVALLYIGARKLKEDKRHSNIRRGGYQLILAVLLAALLINLKRGPWLGVIVAFFPIGLILSRRYLIGALVFILFSLTLGPVRERIMELPEHFVIRGGRQVMWEIGADLTKRYPLGLGPDNASYMRTLDPSIPHQHGHMHNNFLNIAVESGWLGLMAYLWWIATVIMIGAKSWFSTFKLKESDKDLSELGVYALCITCGLIGWQTAGLVEYNFGDGEIRLIAFFLIGVLLAIAPIVKCSIEKKLNP